MTWLSMHLYLKVNATTHKQQMIKRSSVHWNVRAFGKNKAGYTATLVACGWAGAVFELLKHLGKCSEAKDRKNIKKSKMGTDRPTNRPTDRQIKRGVVSCSTRLKIKANKAEYMATPVAVGWAGAENLKMWHRYVPTDRPTDRRTGYKVANRVVCRRPKAMNFLRRSGLTSH